MAAPCLGAHQTNGGLERPEQIAALRELSCRYAQGYLFARPQDAAATLRFLAAAPAPLDQQPFGHAPPAV